MKIDNSVKSSSATASESKSRAAREAPASAPASTESKVELSAHLQRLEQAIGQAPAVDSDKVDEIKQAIAQGQFQVNPEKVADGLIESVRQMLSAQQPRTA
ncbi:MAG TPA: flagellar biosynthesis anti-sigma factor FlgM [Rhodocyclaceae bacterium]|nr:flagellar biosynthesis anti-sigma factor FlgM [Rhodocyclaceae bacterium]